MKTKRASRLLRALGVAGAVLAGSWMAPAQAELVDRGSGLVYDTVLDVTWLQDANLAMSSGYQPLGRASDDPLVGGLLNWAEAMTWASELTVYDAVRQTEWSNWRLPSVAPINRDDVNGNYWQLGLSTRGEADVGYGISAPGTMYEYSQASELAYMYYVNLGNSAACTEDSGGNWQCVDNNNRLTAFNAGLFDNLVSTDSLYWTNSREGLPFAPPDAWGFFYGGDMHGSQGGLNGEGWAGRGLAWAVMDGDVGQVLPQQQVVPEPGSLLLVLASLGLAAVITRRVRPAAAAPAARRSAGR